MNVRCGVILLFASLTSACGFAPRGSITETTSIGVVYILAKDSVPIALFLRSALTDRNFKVSSDQSKASILVQLANEQQSRRIVSVESTGRVSEYELLHSVDMQIARGVSGKAPVLDPTQKPNSVSVIREYTYDRTGVLGKADEADILRSEMRTELVNHLMLRLLANVKQGL